MMGYFIIIVLLILGVAVWLRHCVDRDIERLVDKHFLERPVKEKEAIKKIVESNAIINDSKALYTRISKLLQLESYSLNAHPIAINLVNFFIFRNIQNINFKKVMFVLVANNGIQIYLNEIDPRLKTSILFFKFDDLIDRHTSTTATHIFDVQNKKFYTRSGGSGVLVNDRFKFIVPLVYLLISKLHLYATIAGILTSNCNIDMIDSIRDNNDLYYTDVAKMYTYISNKQKIPSYFTTEQFKKEIMRELARFNQYHLK